MDMAAESSGLSRATISRIESAKQTILPRVVRLLCHSYGTSASILDDLLRLTDKPYERGWLVEYNDATPNWFGRYLDEEKEASEIWEYGAEFIPGLLQTPAYTRAVRAAYSADVTEEDIERSVDFRQARQELLEREAPPDLHAVVNEAALRRLVGGKKVMREQLRHLAEMARQPHLTLQVLPFSAGAHPAMTNSFLMLHFPVEGGEPTIFVEVDSAALYPDHVERYTWTFGRLCELAFAPNKSISLASRLVEEL
jgi:transcriptional regulator with XRE-family HTH domain